MMLACSFIGTDDCNLDVIQLLVQKYDGNVNSIQIVDTIEKGHRVVFNRSLLMSTIDDIGCLNIVKYLVE